MDASEERRYQFVDHFMLVPSVSQLYFAVAERYQALKNDSLLAAVALNAVEKCASRTYAHLGKPLVEKFSGPLRVVDDLAFKALEKLEDTCPLVSQTPIEVFEDACDFAKLKCSDGQAYVLEQIDTCRDLAERTVHAVCCPMETATSLARSARAIFWDVLTVTEYACDQYIKDMVEKGVPEEHYRHCALPRALYVTWKVSLCACCFISIENRWVVAHIKKVAAEALRLLEAPNDPTSEPSTTLDRLHAAAGKAFLLLTIWGQLAELHGNYMTLLCTGDLNMLSEVLSHALSLPLPEDDDMSSSSSDEETVVHVCDTAAGRSEDGSDVSSSSSD